MSLDGWLPYFAEWSALEAYDEKEGEGSEYVENYEGNDDV